jgi:acetyl-CoA carboxylase carboxyl transferase subunit beta
VIKQTIGQDLPEGFQTSEFLLDHGLVDAVVDRTELRATLVRILRHLRRLPAPPAAG